ncbi:YqhA family protein, partial [Escherichia coli]|uniref:YqhA family protein n=1 Tax=Escherichia coli TaxID=562 RepID=UPI003F89D2A1
MERLLERMLFNSRWLLAPFYVALVLSLIMLLVALVSDLVHIVPNLLSSTPDEIILSVLTLIDLSLAGNLVVIV